jgi:hypothetical protein
MASGDICLRDVATAAGLAVIASGAVFAAALSVNASNQAAAVFPPWWSDARIAAAAGSVGRIVGAGALSNIIVVQADQDPTADLRRAGALAVLGLGDGVGCLSVRESHAQDPV